MKQCTVKEMARVLGVSEQSVYYYIKTGKLRTEPAENKRHYTISVVDDDIVYLRSTIRKAKRPKSDVDFALDEPVVDEESNDAKIREIKKTLSEIEVRIAYIKRLMAD